MKEKPYYFVSWWKKLNLLLQRWFSILGWLGQQNKQTKQSNKSQTRWSSVTRLLLYLDQW